MSYVYSPAATRRHATKPFPAMTGIRLRSPFILLLGLLSIAPVGVAQETFTEGSHYQRLRQTQPVQTGEKIEVVEMFWYKCPHCYRLEPYITRWQNNKPENAEFVAVPAILNKNWEFDARMYYTIEALGEEKRLHAEIFEAIHAAKIRLTNFSQFADWLEKHGIPRDKIESAYKSFTVENNVSFARVVSRKYGIRGVPAIIIDGKYRTSVSLAGSHEKLLRIINYLVARSAKERAG